MSAAQYPAITKAALLMTGCNGGINRDRPESVAHALLEHLLMHAEHDLDAIEKWLATRNDEELLTIVDGEQSEMLAALASAPDGTESLMHDIFEEVV